MAESSNSISYLALLLGLPLLECPGFPQPLSVAIQQRFELKTARAGSAESEVLKGLDKETHSWPISHQWLLLDVVNAIAEAEEVRLAWSPKRSGANYRRVSSEAIKALKWVNNLRSIFTEPSYELKILIGRTLDFVAATAGATYSLDVEFAAMVATIELRQFREEVENERLSNVSLVNLVTIALGRRFSEPSQFEESALRRRYAVDRNKVPKSPAAKMWRRHWRLFRELTQWASENAIPRSSEVRAAINISITKALES